MNRRSFLASILVAGIAPAIVRADSLMRVVPRETAIVLPGDAGIYWAPRGDFTVQFWANMTLQQITNFRITEGLARYAPSVLPITTLDEWHHLIVQRRGPTTERWIDSRKLDNSYIES